MGQHRNTTNLAAFAGTLTWIDREPEPRRRRSGGPQVETAGLSPVRPVMFTARGEPLAEDDDRDFDLQPAGPARRGPNGGPLIELAMLRAIVEQSIARGLRTQPLEGHPGEWVRIELAESSAACEFDDATHAAEATGDIVRKDGAMFFRAAASQLN